MPSQMTFYRVRPISKKKFLLKLRSFLLFDFLSIKMNHLKFVLRLVFVNHEKRQNNELSKLRNDD